jgi:hypothetical protein
MTGQDVPQAGEIIKRFEDSFAEDSGFGLDVESSRSLGESAVLFFRRPPMHGFEPSIMLSIGESPGDGGSMKVYGTDRLFPDSVFELYIPKALALDFFAVYRETAFRTLAYFYESHSPYRRLSECRGPGGAASLARRIRGHPCWTAAAEEGPALRDGAVRIAFKPGRLGARASAAIRPFRGGRGVAAEFESGGLGLSTLALDMPESRLEEALYVELIGGLAEIWRNGRPPRGRGPQGHKGEQ